MNGKELADGIESCTTDPLHKEAATMLRDQHIRIAQLLETQEYLYKVHDADKAHLKAAEQLVMEAVERGKALGFAEGMKVSKQTVKELTDEEINRLWAESHEDGIAMQQGFTTQQHYFAHLILRKAQDK